MDKKLWLMVIFWSGMVMTSSAQVSPGQTLPIKTEIVGPLPLQAGNWIVGGSVGSLGYNLSSDSFNADFNPKLGFFVFDNIAFGIGGTWGLSTVKGMDKVWSYGIVPFARYYLPEGRSGTGSFFGEVEAGISGSTGTSNASFLGGLRAGYAQFITNSIALEGTLGYSYSKANIRRAAAVTGLGIGVGFQIYFIGAPNR